MRQRRERAQMRSRERGADFGRLCQIVSADASFSLSFTEAATTPEEKPR